MPFCLIAGAQAQPSVVPSPQPLPQVTLSFGHLSGGLNDAVAAPAHLDYGNGALTIRADHLQGDLLHSNYEMNGRVHAHAYDTTVNADRLHFNGLEHMAFSNNTLLIRRPFTIHARTLRFLPAGLQAADVNLTTAKPTVKPDIELRVSSMNVIPLQNKQGTDTGRERVDLHGASLYLLHNHILTVRHFETTLGRTVGGRARHSGAHPNVGYSGLFGFYVGFGSRARIGRSPLFYNLTLPLHSTPQVLLSSGQVLYAGPPVRPKTPWPALPAPNSPLTTLRVLTSAPKPLLPPGDPLLFYDYLPDGNLIPLFNQPNPAYLALSERLAYHIPSIGHGMDNLFVTRAPEVALSGSIPLTPVYGMPAPGHANAFRRYLRNIALYLGGAVDAGRFYEQPTNISASRLRTSLSLSLRPLLIAPNTVIQPYYAIISNHYTGTSESYHYTQYSLAVSHFFSNDSAVGVRYTASQTGGNSPFNFDVLNTSRELDGRIQLGNRRLTVAGGVAYDIVRSHVIDYTVAVAPGLNGFTPVFSYQFFSRTIGVGFVIPGLTF